jgi:hypothetical protein
MGEPADGAPPGPPASGSRFAVGWSAVLGAVLVVSAVLFAALSWSVLLAGHPAHLVALAVAAVVGLLVLGRAVRLARRPRAPRHGRWLRLLGRAAALVAVLVVVGSFAYLKPFGADPAAVAAMGGGDGVRVTDAATTITLEPTSGQATRGLIFQPGARVDPRAYVPLLERVAADGVLVVVVKQPFDIGFLAVGAPDAVVAAHPEVTAWAVGGHSLGGVAASSWAGANTGTAKGLVLWASYPLGSLADSGLRVASVSGTRDGLATPADIAASRSDLPASTTYTAVEGGVHAFFGDYGEQPGDGTPTVSRADAQRQVVAATTSLLDSL